MYLTVTVLRDHCREGYVIECSYQSMLCSTTLVCILDLVCIVDHMCLLACSVCGGITAVAFS